jgi:hypothetical protein
MGCSTDHKAPAERDAHRALVDIYATEWGIQA